MDIDVIGFSRGASQARDFANRIVAQSVVQNGKTYYSYKNKQGEAACQEVNFRFMGLWDTVLSTNRSDYSYQLGIPSQFSYVAHAVALNEYRSGGISAAGDAFNLIGPWEYRNPKKYSQHAGGFPLESIGASSNTPGKVRIEMGFIGAHADIGGGYPESESQLSLVALSWMVKQASEAGVTMKPAPSLPIGSAILHDQSNAIRVGNPQNQPVVSSNAESGETTVYRAEDRTVRGAVSGSSQRAMGFGNNSMTNTDTLNGGFIAYTPRDPTLRHNAGGSANPRALLNQTGTVDMDKYIAWLRDPAHGYAFAN